MGIGSIITYSLLFISLYFEIFLLVSYLQRTGGRGRKITPLPRAALPSVAIIVPCMNEQKSIGSTVRSLLALDYPSDKLEIIVVDDGSTDNTLSLVREIEAAHTGRLQVFHKENGGKHSAMNMGLATTRAELVGCLDADSIVDSQALLKIVPFFADQKIAAVTPGIHVKEPENILQHVQKVEYRLSIFNRFMLSALGSAFCAPGPFSILRTSIVRELGGWRYAHSTEDMEIALRIQMAGYKIANAPEAIVHTATPRTVRGLFKQRVRWTYGFLRNSADYHSMFGNRKYGNLGLIVLPTALASIGIAIYFFVRVVIYAVSDIMDQIVRIEIMGFSIHPSLNLFYINTSITWFLVYVCIMLILILISTGSLIGTGKRTLPAGTPLFILFYGFLVPIWLSTALVRAVFKTGVRWR